MQTPPPPHGGCRIYINPELAEEVSAELDAAGIAHRLVGEPLNLVCHMGSLASFSMLCHRLDLLSVNDLPRAESSVIHPLRAARELHAISMTTETKGAPAGCGIWVNLSEEKSRMYPRDD